MSVVFRSCFASSIVSFLVGTNLRCRLNVSVCVQTVDSISLRLGPSDVQRLLVLREGAFRWRAARADRWPGHFNSGA